MALTDRVSRSIVLARSQRESGLREPPLLIRHQSLSDLKPNFSKTMTEPAKTVRLCHHCHAPQSNPAHAGIPTGSGNCTLQHWDECQLQKEEGYDKREKWWTGCPGLSELERTKGEIDPDYDPDDSTEVIDDEIQLKQQVPPNDTIKEGMNLSTNSKLSVDDSGEDTEDEEDRLAAEELDQLQQRIEEREKQVKADELLALKVAQKEKKRSDRLYQRGELERKRAELLKREKLVTEKRASMSIGLSKSAPRSTVAAPKSSLDAQNLKYKAAAHAARQQKAAADQANLQSANSMTIAGIREMPGMTQMVDGRMTRFQSTIPALATDPTATPHSTMQFQPPGVLNTGTSLTVAPGYVYVAELGQLVPTVSSFGSSTRAAVSGLTQAGVRSDVDQDANVSPEQSDSEVSADEDCPVSPSPGNRLVWKIDSQGRKYCKERLIRDKSPEVVTTWVKRADGRIYKELTTRSKLTCSEKPYSTIGQSASSKVKAPFTTPRRASSPIYRDHRQSSTSCRTNTRPVSREERQPTFISTEERSGKESNVSSLIKRSRACPVSWTVKITSEQLNPIIWSWGYIAELLASRTGQAEDLPAGELEARLQHYLNVLEVTLQTSNKTDYMGDSWKVGRLYHTKVQAKVDQGTTTWCKMMDRWESATLPHELMAAQQELAPKPTKTKQIQQEIKGKEGDGRPVRCGTWNTWETKGTCKYEVDNPNYKCNRLHECTYCKTKKFKPVNHQRLFCQKRIEAGTD